MKRLNPCTAWLTAALLLLSGCGSTGVGNPGVQQQELALTADDGVEPGADDEAQLESDVLTHAYVVFGEVRFLACESGVEDVVLQGPFVVDLLAGDVQPELPAFDWPSGGVCGVDATLAPAETPRRLEGRSFFFSGVRDGTLFILVADMPGTLRIRPLPMATWEPEAGPWLLALRPRRWLLPEELANETSDEGSAVDAVSDLVDVENVERVVAINVNRHPVLYELIRSRFARRSTLHVDANGNGKLDTRERGNGYFIGQGLADLE